MLGSLFEDATIKEKLILAIIFMAIFCIGLLIQLILKKKKNKKF